MRVYTSVDVRPSVNICTLNTAPLISLLPPPVRTSLCAQHYAAASFPTSRCSSPSSTSSSTSTPTAMMWPISSAVRAPQPCTCFPCPALAKIHTRRIKLHLNQAVTRASRASLQNVASPKDVALPPMWFWRIFGSGADVALEQIWLRRRRKGGTVGCAAHIGASSHMGMLANSAFGSNLRARHIWD